MTKYYSENEIPLVLSAKDVAKALGISEANAYGIMHNKTFPTFSVGKRMLVRKCDFLEWIAKLSTR